MNIIWKRKVNCTHLVFNALQRLGTGRDALLGRDQVRDREQSPRKTHGKDLGTNLIEVANKQKNILAPIQL